MAFVRKETGLVYGEVKCDDAGKFLNVDAYKRVGIWDDVTATWADPPQLAYAGTYSLAQFKAFVAALS